MPLFVRDLQPQLDPIFGDLTYLDAMRRVQVKGNLVRSRARWVTEKSGAATLRQVADRVSPEARTYLLAPPMATEWRSFGPLMDVDRAIVEGPMRGDLGRMMAFGEDIARYDLPSIYQSLLRMLSSPAFLLRRSALVYGMYLKDAGEIRSEAEDGHAQVTLHGRVLPMYFCTQGLTGWIAASVGLYGSRDIRLLHPKCRHHGDDFCRWQVTWR